MLLRHLADLCRRDCGLFAGQPPDIDTAPHELAPLPGGSELRGSQQQQSSA